VATLLTALLGCADAPEPALENPLGSFNFTLESRPAAEQVGLLQELDYQGVTFIWPGAEAFQGFVTAPAVRSGGFRVFAVLYDFAYAQPWRREDVEEVLLTLAPHGADLWLRLIGPAGLNPMMVEAVREVVAMATARGVRVVVYPHDEDAIENVEEALALIKAVGRPELKASLHLCHELKAGHRDRLAEVIAAAAPHLVLASINGASKDVSAPGWAEAIQPLDRGDLDVRNTYLLPLIRSGYTGPLILHTYGLEDRPEEHLRRSSEAWHRMSREVAATLGK
jgi:hypothetical protein